MDRIIKTLLANRGLKTKKQREEFFEPPNPEEKRISELEISEKELKKAVKRIQEATKNKEKIIVYGDYDVDGICATGILWETLHFLGARALPYIPNRFTEGYGLNEESIKKLKKEDPKLSLIITVDHGITAHEKIDFAQSLGVDVIITDHHEPGETRPKAHAVVHTTKVSGSTVAWVLSRELERWNVRTLEKSNASNASIAAKRSQASLIASSILNDHLGLAALGTVADVLPLIGHNRSIVVHGLQVLRATDRPGIKALCREAGINQEEISTFHIGFILGPRLNAMGRVEHALDSLRLLCTRSKGRASELSLKLGKTNRLRQEKTETALLHVNDTFVPLWSNGNLPKLLFVHHESYEEGVIGVVAGRLVDKYHRPAIVVSRGEEFSKASARSIKGVNIIETIKQAGGEMLVSAGGHTMAAGFTLRTEHLELLADKLTEVGEAIPEEALVKDTRFDCEINFSLITTELYGELSKFAPFGYGNPQPTFRTRGVYVENARLVGKNNEHLKLVLSQRSSDEAIELLSYEAIGFRMGERYAKLSPEKPVDVVYSIEEDEWDGRKRLQLKLKVIQEE